MRIEAQRRTSSRSVSPPAWALLVLGLVLGAVLGLVYAWIIDPVEYLNADPSDLSVSGQRVWVQMVADSLAVTGDEEAARRRLNDFTDEELALLLGEQVQLAESQGDLAQQQRLAQLAALANAVPATTAGEQVVEANGNILGTLLMACGFALLTFVVVGGVAVFITRARQDQGSVQPRTVPARAHGGNLRDDEKRLPLVVDEDEEDEVELDALFDDLPGEYSYADEDEEEVRTVDFAEPAQQPTAYSPALNEFVTRYNYGDDGYDVSFSIETTDGEFLGETGVGISDALNQGSPQKVTAFEVWLFDKDDIRTVTKVLLSAYAWDNEELRNRLAPKGQLVRVEEGDTLDLETRSLRVRARIREVEYGEGGPGAESYFERFVVELTPQQKG